MAGKHVTVGAYRGFGIFLILLGLALIATSICDLILTTCHFDIADISSGVWSGIFILIVGALGVSVSKNESRGLLSTHLAFAIIASLIAIGPLVCGSIGLSMYLDRDNGYIVSERPRIECAGIYHSADFVYNFKCYYRPGCCECQYYYNTTNGVYAYEYSYDFGGERMGIIFNSLLAGIGLTAMITCIVSATLFCKSTTCCPSNKMNKVPTQAQSQLGYFIQGQPPVQFMQSPPEGFVQQTRFQPGQMQMAQGQSPAQNFVYLNPSLVHSQAGMQTAQQ